MKLYTFKDIIGPIMIGPSSSHTAGALRIAQAAKLIAGKRFTQVNYYLAGSFAKTYQGHGTDRALVGGSLGMAPDDENIKESFAIAKEQGLEFAFIPIDNPGLHANTAIVEMIFPNGDATRVTGCSIGGGNMLITNVDDAELAYSGKFPTLILHYPDTKFIISKTTSILAEADLNIENIQTAQPHPPQVVLVIEVNQAIEESYLQRIRAIPEVASLIYIPALEF